MFNKVENLIFTDNLDLITENLFSPTNRFCLIVCLTGSIQLTRCNENFVIHEDEMAIWDTDLLVGHYMRTPDFTGYLLSIDDRMVKELLVVVCRVEPRWWEIMHKLHVNPVMRLKDEHHKELLKSYFGLLKLYMTDEQTDYRKKTYMLLAKMVSYDVLSQMDKEIRADDTNDNITAADRLMREFINMLRNDDGSHREVAWFAERLSITPKHLSTIAKEKTKLNASTLIQQVTCERIKHYLLDTDMSIKEIAFRLKFPTASFFCKYVRKHLGMSPLELRNK